MYQGGGRPAAASYKAYLSSDAAPGRADGYGLREWRHDPSGALWNVSTRDGAGCCCRHSSVGGGLAAGEDGVLRDSYGFAAAPSQLLGC